MEGTKTGRPFTYQSEDERPRTVSVRIPRELFQQLEARVNQRRTTMTEAILEAVRLWVETPADPRDLLPSDNSNTVIPQLEELVEAAVERYLAKRHATQDTEPTAPAPAPAPTRDEIPSYNSTTVIQHTGPGEEGMKQCGVGHKPYPASKRECPICHKERQARYRERQSTGTAKATT